jgi:caffeoyl-CoA O-methyltransferase
MDMTPERWTYTTAYSNEVFGTQDEHLAGLMSEAIATGLPDIAVSADVGRFLMILTSMTPGRLALELGTLGGYSGIWIARGLRPDGLLITVEAVERHADFAQRQFERAGVADKVQIRRGPALTVLPVVAREVGELSVDLAFVDATKTEYVDYFHLLKPLLAPGGLLVADNVYGTSSGWIDLDTPGIRAVDRFNRAVAADPDFEAVAVPLREGVLVARRNAIH